MKHKQVGTNSKSIREYNCIQVLKEITIKRECSRMELATRLGLSKMTISNIVTHLIELGYIYERPYEKKQSASVGPKATALALVEKKLLGLGIHITDQKIIGQIIDISTGMIDEYLINLHGADTGNKLLFYLKKVIEYFLDKWKDYAENILVIGIMYDGRVDEEQGRLAYVTIPGEKEEVNVRSVLEKRYGIPIYIGSYVCGEMLAELRFGLRLAKTSCIYINISKEIRGAILSNHIVQQGRSGKVCEMGHMSIRYDGPLCECGNRGCYRLYGSTEVLLRQSQCHSLEELLLKLEQREPKSLRVMDDFMQVTTVALTNIINLYHPDYIILGGDITRFDASIVRQIEHLVNERSQCRGHFYTKVLTGKLSGQQLSMGAALIGLYEIYHQNTFTREL